MNLVKKLDQKDYSFTAYKPFSPTQIKSAIGNRGTSMRGRGIFFLCLLKAIPATHQFNHGTDRTLHLAQILLGMAKDNKEVATLLRKSYEDEFGEPLRAQDFTEEQVNCLRFARTRGEAALGEKYAVDWYTSAVERALEVAEEIFPDIGQKFEAKDRSLVHYRSPVRT